MKKTKKAYTEYLNEIGPNEDSDEWIIGGVIRMYHKWRNEYGVAIRKYDPIAFEVGYNEWKKM